MNKTDIITAIEGAVSERGCFIVDVQIGRENEIEITIESEEGTVEMDDCTAINNTFLQAFDQDKEDYSLTVTSAGLDRPFKMFKQFVKAVGSDIDVSFKGGKKITGTLLSAAEDTIKLRYTAKETVEGKKKKELVTHEDDFAMTEINSVLPHIDFE